MVVGHYSVLDRKADEYSPVFTAKNDEVARRLVVNSLSDHSQLVLYPADYTIVHLCDFDVETGEIIQLSGSFVHVAGEVADLIPGHLRGFCLDGTFPRVRSESDEKQASQSAAEKS